MLLLSSCLDPVSLAKRACQVFGYWLILGGLAVAAAAAIGFSIYVVVALVHAVSR